MVKVFMMNDLVRTVMTTTGALALLVARPPLTAAQTPAAVTKGATLEFLARGSITAADVDDRWLFGGISGLAWDAANNALIAMSDAKDQARAYTIPIDVAAIASGSFAVSVSATHHLPQKDGNVNPRDAEAITPDGEGGFAIAFEAPPMFVRFNDKLSQQLLVKPAPEELSKRLIPNRAVESFTLTPGGGPLGVAPSLLAITEWGPEPTNRNVTGADRLKARGRCAALALDPATLAVRAKGIYPLGRIFTTKGGKSLAEIASIDSTSFLALERFIAPGAIYNAELFVVTIAAGDTADEFTLLKTPVKLPSFPGIEHLGNLEAMAIGPEIPDAKGGRLLLMATDNNFADEKFGRPNTDFLAFRLILQK